MSKNNDEAVRDIVGCCLINVIGKGMRVFKCGKGATCSHCRKTKKILALLSANDKAAATLRAEVKRTRSEMIRLGILEMREGRWHILRDDCDGSFWYPFQQADATDKSGALERTNG